MRPVYVPIPRLQDGKYHLAVPQNRFGHSALHHVLPGKTDPIIAPEQKTDVPRVLFHPSSLKWRAHFPSAMKWCTASRRPSDTSAEQVYCSPCFYLVYLIFMSVGVEIEFQRDGPGTDDLPDLYFTSSHGSFLIQPSRGTVEEWAKCRWVRTCTDLQWKHFIISLRRRRACEEAFFFFIFFWSPIRLTVLEKFLRTPSGKNACLP